MPLDYRFVFVFLLLVALFTAGVGRGRRNESKAQRLAFNAGLVGLVALPMWLLATAGLMLQLMWTNWFSVPGVAWVLSSIVIAIAAMVVPFGLFGTRSKEANPV